MSFRIFLCTLPNGYFGSTGRTWKGMNLDVIAEHLKKLSDNVLIVSIDNILEYDIKYDDVVIYTSSEEKSMRSYIKDVLYLVSKNSLMVPSYESLLAHENKGFQQLMRNNLGFGNLRGVYHYDLDVLPVGEKLVFKCVDGAGSSKVRLINSKSDIKKIRRKYFSVGMYRKCIKFVRKFLLTKSEYAIYNYRHKGFIPFVFQCFIPNLDCDYKVLVFGNQYFVLKRSVRKKDFRASGSGYFSFDTPPSDVLDFARDVFSVLDVPFASLDIAISSDGCHLIEYQVLNFGPYSLIASPGYYSFSDDSGWIYTNSNSLLEEVYARSLCVHLMKKRV